MSAPSHNQSIQLALDVKPVVQSIDRLLEVVRTVQNSIPDHCKVDASSGTDGEGAKTKAVNGGAGGLLFPSSAGGESSTTKENEVKADGCSIFSLCRRGSAAKAEAKTGEVNAVPETEPKVAAGKKDAPTSGGDRAVVTGPVDGCNPTTSKDEVKSEANAAGSSERPPSAGKKGSGQEVNGHTVNGQMIDSKANVDSSTHGNGVRRLEGKNLEAYNQAEKLVRDLNYIKSQLSKLDGIGDQFKGLPAQIEQLSRLQDTIRDPASFSTEALQTNLHSLAEQVKGVKNKMPGRNAPTSTAEGAGRHVEKDTAFNSYNLLDKKAIPDMKERICVTSCFKSLFEDFDQAFRDLDLQLKLCLLCFSIFPENAVVRKKLLVHWWTGEGFLDSQSPDNKAADNVLKRLCSKGFIKPKLKKHKIYGFQMDPLVRFVLIIIAERLRFFDFDSMGIPTAEFSFCHRACLVKNNKGEFSRGDLTRESDSEKNRDKGKNGSERNKGKEKNMNHLHTLFNVNDPYPDFKLDWFSKLEMLNVLYLGGWQGSEGHHIEVESTEFLRALKKMKDLKFLSLQGISRITELPDSLCELTNLNILDLNACHHLESLPEKLDKFKSLMHLDISECYLLDHIPKGLGQLEKLQVLKGFVIGSSEGSCTLDDLKGLKNLRKLSITSSREDFPRKKEVGVLQGFQYLKKLTIAWGGTSTKESANSSEEEDKGNDKQAKEGGKGKHSEEKGDKPYSPEQKEKDEAKSAKQKKGDDGNITEQKKENKEKGLEQKGHKEIEAEKNKEDKEQKETDEAKSAKQKKGDDGNITEQKKQNKEKCLEQKGHKEIEEKNKEDKEQHDGGGSSAEQKKAQTGKGTERKVVFAPNLAGDTSEQKDGKGKDVKTKGEKGDSVEQVTTSPKSPHAMQAQQSAQPPAAANLIRTPTKLGRVLSRKTDPTTFPRAPGVLEKLELQCCPLDKAPSWMIKGNMMPSKKLYIRGGNLRSLKDGQGKRVKWDVKILCLKYLADLEMDWGEFQESFPNVVYLEKSLCPKLSFFPCNSKGVWINKDSVDLEEAKKDLSWSFLA